MWNLVGGIVFQLIGVLIFIGTTVRDEREKIPRKVSRQNAFWALLFLLVGGYLLVQYGKTF